ncbi:MULTISPECIES: DUF2142 domain-containing protein [Microbacterium]|uniref:DUF2142 domain-containing protein n=1 Tax=Microbacterium maritypicum TaxID=33918 RepID=A0A4Y4B4V9_MICMQ|nr:MULTISPECIES: DUF2142 domain-containing protein [Microbacterium]QYG10547.1 DUF2142 domain-containing protein [Microbacterium sp. PAMC22086]GEC75551.1 hypothetical protein MLI01_16960 [Microbacterium liquefaciens]GGV56877.1 hypothetical protein GCM10010213_17760 [Microbacterium liquefaciens]
MTRRTRQIVAAVLAPLALLVALLAWGVSSPQGSSPDEDYHMGSIWCANGPIEGRCETTDSDRVRALPSDLAEAAQCFAFKPDQAATCPLDENGMTYTQRGNWYDNGYPPVFYGVMTAFVTDDVSLSILMMRAFNALLFVGVLCALFFLLPLRMRPNLVWASLIGIVPLGMFLIPSANPSSWAILQASGLWLAVWGFFEQTGRKKVALAALSTVLMLIGAGARSDAAAYGVVALAVAVVLAFRPTRGFLLQLLLPAGLAVIAGALFLTSGQSGVLTSTTESGDLPFFSLLFSNVQALPQLWIGALGFWGLGWLDTQLPALVWGTTFGLFAALLFWGLKHGNARKWLAMAGVLAALVVVPLYILMREGIMVGSGVQPRYVYPLVIMLVGVALVGLKDAALGLTRVQVGVVAAGIIGANSIALHTNLRRYITGADGTGINLDRGIEWWWNAPLSPMGVWALGSLAFAAAIVALVWSVWPSITRTSPRARWNDEDLFATIDR